MSEDRRYSWRNRIVFLSNIPFHYKAQDILLMLRQFGRCFRVDLARNHQDGRSRGFCYVEFEKAESAQIATQYLDNAELDGRYLRAELAQFPPDDLVNMYAFFLTPDIRPRRASGPRRIGRRSPRRSNRRRSRK
jgi:RNA recognition motif-containing protein